MNQLPKISESEWEIMKVIWKHHPISAEQIMPHLSDQMEWSEPTVRTFLNRLLKKNAIGYEKSRRSYLYYPLVSESDCVKAESRSFLQRVFNGAADLMVSNFIKEAQLSDKEIEQLKKILEEKQGKEKQS
ncbi:BlaI/MecI/CopY family transcriptional regulator [Paenibacillus turpanensis]|uniref:BlaI/MecI/CopY family transcriptional regulator n=1 Tax=Paenibacillus turpanensis TaxID=2689078 RepID=UPI00140A280F|nr:BlaI/MecI/CopY family transcriptional regulator [Paenibacillus turpanensis]